MRLLPTKRDKAVGPCPKCGKRTWWWNDVPLTGSCWGPESKPHAEVNVLPPPELQPYWGNPTKAQAAAYRRAYAQQTRRLQRA